jgi:predicted nucleic acid-binding protein
MIVVDASVALKWFVDEDGSPTALSLLAGADRLLAPELVIAEICNAAWRMSRIGRMTREQVAIVAAQAGQLFHERVSLDALSVRATHMALRLDHPAYDCFYLALAEQREAQVVTADDRFVAKTRATPWDGRVVSLTDFSRS